ncbi:hypothetical protein ACFL3Q_16560 [Planctomycetota bacterium]
MYQDFFGIEGARKMLRGFMSEGTTYLGLVLSMPFPNLETGKQILAFDQGMSTINQD